MGDTSIVTAILAFVFVLAVILPVVTLAVLARVNYHVRKDVAPSRRRESELRWNFWTFGLVGLGTLVRVALSEPRSMDAVSARLRTWARLYLVWSFSLGMAGLLVALKPSLLPLVYLVDALPVLYFFRQLSAQSECAPAATAARKTLRLIFWTLGLALLAGCTAVAVGRHLLPVLMGSAALVVGIRASIHLMRTMLVVGIVAKEAGETDDTVSGGRDAAMGLAYFAVVMALSIFLSFFLGLVARLT